MINFCRKLHGNKENWDESWSELPLRLILLGPPVHLNKGNFMDGQNLNEYFMRVKMCCVSVLCYRPLFFVLSIIFTAETYCNTLQIF